MRLPSQSGGDYPPQSGEACCAYPISASPEIKSCCSGIAQYMPVDSDCAFTFYEYDCKWNGVFWWDTKTHRDMVRLLSALPTLLYPVGGINIGGLLGWITFLDLQRFLRFIDDARAKACLWIQHSLRPCGFR